MHTCVVGAREVTSRRGWARGVLWFSVAVAALIAGALVAGARQPEETSPPLVLLADRDYPPLSYLESGAAAGLDVDVAQALARRMGREIRVEVTDWDVAQRRVLRGEADGLLSMSISPERQALFDFTDPIVTHDFGFFVRRADLALDEPGGFVGSRIGVTRGGFPRRVLEAEPGLDLVLIRNYEDGFDRLAAGTIDAVAADRWVGAYTIERHALPDIVAAGPPFATRPGAIAVRKGQGALIGDLDAAVRALKSDGTLGQIQDRWRSEEMLFMSRQRVNRLVRLAAAASLTIAGAVALWIVTVRSQARPRPPMPPAANGHEHTPGPEAVAAIDSVERHDAERVHLLARALQSANDCVMETEEALRRTELRYREVVENAHDVIFTVDREGHCLSMNPAGRKLTGYVAEDARGIHLSQLVAPHHVGFARQQLERVLAGEDVPTFELAITNREGRLLTLELAVHAVMGDDGAPSGVQGIARDITARKELEDQLRQSQKLEAIGRLAGGIAHDFNNLLTAILGYSALVSDDLPSDSPLREDVAEIQRAANVAESLTRQLLIFSRKDVVQPVEVDLNESVTRVERLLRRIVGERIDLTVRLAPTIGYIHADEGQIEQVVMNLVINARDAMPSGGTLRVETAAMELDETFARTHPGARAGSFARLTVSDTGHGMTPEVQAEIFTPFFTTKSPSTGTGLGLAIVHGIVQQWGGWIGVESAIGVGTRFSIYFPLMPATVLDPAVDPVSVSAGLGSGTVLFVEDDECIRTLGTRMLRQKGFKVLPARHAGEALLLAGDPDRRIDLLLTDIVMPGLSGRDLAARMLESRPNLKVLYTSGYNDDIAAVHELNGPAFLRKPYAPDALVRRIRALLAAE